MSEQLAKQSELLKLARILDTDPGTLDFLGDHDADQLRMLREGVTDGLFDRFRPKFAGFARMTGLAPLKISAKIAEQVLGSMLSGRVASEMKPERAIEMTTHLPDEFLADTCLQLDPSRSQEIIAGMPIPRVLNLTRILQKRGEFITMGRFVDYMPLDMLLSAAKVIDNDADLLQIGFFVEDNHQLSRIITLLPEPRKDGVIKAASRQGLWPEALSLIASVDQEAQSQLTEQALDEEEEEETVDSLIKASAEHDLWPTILPLLQGVSDFAIKRFANQPILSEDDVSKSLVTSVAEHGNFADLGNLLANASAPSCANILASATEHAPETATGLAQAAEGGSDAVSALQAGAKKMDTDARKHLAELCGDTPLGAAL